MNTVIQSPDKPRVGSGLPGPGRPRGSENRINRDVRAMVLAALNEAGGQAYLVRQAEANPKAFLALVARVIPKEVAIEVTRQYVVALPAVSRNADAWLERVHDARHALEVPPGVSTVANGSGPDCVATLHAKNPVPDKAQAR